MHTGLFFGSFNPIHIGHLALAEYMTEYTSIEQVWFVVSPHNPLKLKETLLADYHRLELVHLAVDHDIRFRVSDIEFRMPQPSYTIDTLVYLKEKFPDHNFSLIMGADNLNSFHKWKNTGKIVKDYHRFVYPRHGSATEDMHSHENITLVNAPKMEISSSFLRQAIRDGKSMRYFFPEKVYNYIDQMNFYRK